MEAGRHPKQVVEVLEAGISLRFMPFLSTGTLRPRSRAATPTAAPLASHGYCPSLAAFLRKLLVHKS